MGELVKKVKIDAGDYQRGTDETGKRLKFISATQTLSAASNAAFSSAALSFFSLAAAARAALASASSAF